MKKLTEIRDVNILRCMVRLLQLENGLLRSELRNSGCVDELEAEGMQLPLDVEAFKKWLAE